MKKRTHQPAQTPQELLNDLRNLVVETEQLAAKSVSEYSEEALEAIQARYEAAQKSLSALVEGTKKKVIAGAETADEVIREKPYQAIAIAAGVAVVVGLLLGRRSRQ